MSFQLGIWCWLEHTVRAQASAHASTSETPQTVAQVLGWGSLEKAPTLLSILLEVHTRSQTKISSEPFSRPPRMRSSSVLRLVARTICCTATAGMAAPIIPHHHSTMLILELCWDDNSTIGVQDPHDFIASIDASGLQQIPPWLRSRSKTILQLWCSQQRMVA